MVLSWLALGGDHGLEPVQGIDFRPLNPGFRACFFCSVLFLSPGFRQALVCWTTRQTPKGLKVWGLGFGKFNGGAVSGLLKSALDLSLKAPEKLRLDCFSVVGLSPGPAPGFRRPGGGCPRGLPGPCSSHAQDSTSWMVHLQK